jgi:hypothetical protein
MKNQMSFRLSDQAVKNLMMICRISGVNHTAAVEIALTELSVKLTIKKGDEMTYKINTHCQDGEDIFSAAKRVLGNTPHMVSLDRDWERFVRDNDAPLPADVPTGYIFAGFVTVRQHETFPVFYNPGVKIQEA